jgi:hypothetical protein
VPAAFAFALGAPLTSFAFSPFLEPLPAIAAADAARIGITFIVMGGLWWRLSIAGLMWAPLRPDFARVGILLMPKGQAVAARVKKRAALACRAKQAISGSAW